MRQYVASATHRVRVSLSGHSTSAGLWEYWVQASPHRLMFSNSTRTAPLTHTLEPKLWPCRGIISTGLSMQFKGRYLSVWFDKNTYPSIPESPIRRLCRFRLLGKRNRDSVLLRNTYTAVGPCRLFPSLKSSQSLFVVHFYYVHFRTKIFCKAFTNYVTFEKKQRGYVLTTTATAALIISNNDVKLT